MFCFALQSKRVDAYVLSSALDTRAGRFSECFCSDLSRSFLKHPSSGIYLRAISFLPSGT